MSATQTYRSRENVLERITARFPRSRSALVLMQLQRHRKTRAAVESQTTKSPNKWGFRTSSSPFPRADSLPVIRSHPDAHDGVDLEFGPQGRTRTYTISRFNSARFPTLRTWGCELASRGTLFLYAFTGRECRSEVQSVLRLNEASGQSFSSARLPINAKHGGFEPRHLTLTSIASPAHATRVQPIS